MYQKMKVFISYAHEDNDLRRQLVNHLSLLKHQNFIDVWHDRNISAGQDWKHEIDAHLNDAQIILLLVSADFLASDYCYSIEMQRAMERHEQGEACVIPIILRPVYWTDAPFGKVQALPTGAKPVLSSGWYSTDEALFDIVEGIRKVVRKEQAAEPPKTRMRPAKKIDTHLQRCSKVLTYEIE